MQQARTLALARLHLHFIHLHLLHHHLLLLMVGEVVVVEEEDHQPPRLQLRPPHAVSPVGLRPVASAEPAGD